MTTRTEFSAKTKEAALQRSGGLCECQKEDGTRCGLPLRPGKIVYDHRNPDWLGGDNSLSNCQVLGWCCDKPKTAKDQADIAKVKRIRRLENGIRKPRTITRWRKFNREVVTATRER